MANYTSATLTVHPTTAAGVGDRVTITGDRAGLRIQNRSGTDGLWYCWSVDGNAATPASDGSVDGSYYLPPGEADTWEDPVARRGEIAVDVRVISAAAVAYSVETWKA
jgi:hypothetical protein